VQKFKKKSSGAKGLTEQMHQKYYAVLFFKQVPFNFILRILFIGLSMILLTDLGRHTFISKLFYFQEMPLHL
jgi:hypothetical protein